FRGHPKIGHSKGSRWSRQEQSKAKEADDDTRRQLQQLNQRYQRRFAYIYIVCATGKSAEEMLDMLKKRLKNAPAKELRIAAIEQVKITHIRLNKLLAS